MRRARNILNAATAEAWAAWLERHAAPGELAARVERIFLERGPALPRRVRTDLAEFLRERSAADLARAIAQNDDPRDDAEFAAWAKETGHDLDG